ncbi:LysR substrate-binding domain-containing protein [Ruegeria arenilitoris]|uniref:LysR substrate-binding domain-containing protein n=1 Tax=Ruegeria arenilitoris TaxID=1173585 RepID=UPI00147EFC02|nr:LysR substrate-binding domain-containing protein [Ruegeria arenilitoris]
MKPSLPALRAFETAARLGSFRAASKALSVTPTAISHHIRGLEDQLGTKLFVRSGREVTLTEDGERLADAARLAFGILDEAVRALHRRPRKVVRLAAGSIFTARWLMPRISEFWDSHPDIELEVLPTFEPGTTARENIHIVIRWNRMAYASGDAIKLLELSPVAIASRAFVAANGPIEHPRDLLDLPLLHQRNHWGWLDWFSAMNVPVADRLRGAIFEDANALLRGAAEGHGIVIGWLPLINQDLAEGRVIRLFNEEIPPTHGYFIEVRGTNPARREVQQVVDWLAN